MTKAANLSTKQPVKLIFVGGFLGSGKTTALAGLAKRLISQGKRVGIITNDQSENLADTVIVNEMLHELGVPVEEVVEGCFCCKFEDLINRMEKVLEYEPDIMMGEPVGSCTDFVAAVANPIKIHYKEAFRFAPFCTMVDPDRVQELLLGEIDSEFPEEVAYLFQKQLEEADIVLLNKIDLLSDQAKEKLVAALINRFPNKAIMAISAQKGTGMDTWLETLLTGRPGANTVLREIDYDRYAQAEAILGWLNGAVKMTCARTFESSEFLGSLMGDLQLRLKQEKAEIGHLKSVLTAGGKSMWANLTRLDADITLSDARLAKISSASLIINARVKIEPERLEAIVRAIIASTSQKTGINMDILDLQCFSPAYPNPPHLVRETVE